MTTEDLMKLADKFAFFMPGSEEGEKARQALLDALQAQAERIKELEAELSRTDVLLEECKMDWSGDVIQIKAEHKYEIETLRAQLAALQSDDELPEPAVGFDYDYYEGLIRYEAPVPRFCETSYYTADQLRQAQAMVRAKMVALEKDAARYRWRVESMKQEAETALLINDAPAMQCGLEQIIKEADAELGITGEPK